MVKYSNVAPKNRPRCGNEFTDKKNKVKNKKGVNSNRKKDIYNVYIKDDSRFLVLEYMASENGKACTLDKKEEFQIVSLEEDRIVLRKVNDHAAHF